MNDVWTYWVAHQQQILGWTATTIWLATVPVIAGLAVAVPLGIVAARRRGMYAVVVGTANVVYSIPSLVLFLLLPSLLGTAILNPLNVAVALTIYTTALLVRSVADGINQVPVTVVSAAKALGHTNSQITFGVELPVATPVIAGALRVAAVANVSLVSVASVIGTAQLGQLFVAGSNTGALAPVYIGLVLFVAIAAAMDAAIQVIARALSPWTGAMHS